MLTEKQIRLGWETLRKRYAHHEGQNGFWAHYLAWLDKRINGEYPLINPFTSRSPEPGRIVYPYEMPLRQDKVLYALENIEAALRSHSETVRNVSRGYEAHHPNVPSTSHITLATRKVIPDGDLQIGKQDDTATDEDGSGDLLPGVGRGEGSNPL